MPWALIIALIIEFLPYILSWLEELFKKSAKKMGLVPQNPATFRYELEELFNQAESNLSWWDFFTGKRAKLRLVRRIILRRSDEFLHAAQTNSGVVGITPPTDEERYEMSGVFSKYKKR